MKQMEYDVVVVGGGPGGMAAAVTAAEEGAGRVLLVDRNGFLGGILPQCIHDGFGLQEFHRQLTGAEYACAWIRKLADSGVECLTETTVVTLKPGTPQELELTGPSCGFVRVRCRAVVLATGCRERSAGQLRIPGSRPAGIFTAGSVQYMMNRQNLLPGRSAVILGLGDVGLIMARRLTLEGIRVRMILGQEAGGLLRNYIQCVRDLNIPLKLGYTVVSTHGYERLKGVTIAPIDSSGNVELDRKQYVPCDTLLLAAGLIPETELWKQTGEALNPAGGVPVDGAMHSSCPGIFACGNMVRVYDTADQVSQAGRTAGRAAACWLREGGRADAPGLPPVHPGRRLTEEDVERGGSRLVCTMCPNGCVLEVSGAGDALRVEGSGCSRGRDFALQERSDPRRILTTTVRLEGSDHPLLPVRTDRPVSLSAFPAIMKAVRKLRASAPVTVGQILLERPAGVEADLLAAADADSLH